MHLQWPENLTTKCCAIEHAVSTLVFFLFLEYLALECITNQEDRHGLCFCLSFDSDMDKLVESLSVLERDLLGCLVEIPIYYYYF